MDQSAFHIMRDSSFDVTSAWKIDIICLCKGFLQYFKNKNVKIPVPGYLYTWPATGT